MTIWNDLKNILNICFFLCLNLYHGIKIFKSKVPDIFEFCLQYKTIQRFSKTWHSLNINFTLIMKFNLENRIFYVCPNVAGFVKNVFKWQIRSSFKKEILKDEHFDVARTRKCAEVARTRKWVARTPPLASGLRPSNFSEMYTELHLTCSLK